MELLPLINTSVHPEFMSAQGMLGSPEPPLFTRIGYQEIVSSVSLMIAASSSDRSKSESNSSASPKLVALSLS